MCSRAADRECNLRAACPLARALTRTFIEDCGAPDGAMRCLQLTGLAATTTTAARTTGRTRTPNQPLHPPTMLPLPAPGYAAVHAVLVAYNGALASNGQQPEAPVLQKRVLRALTQDMTRKGTGKGAPVAAQGGQPEQARTPLLHLVRADCWLWRTRCAAAIMTSVLQLNKCDCTS